MAPRPQQNASGCDGQKLFSQLSKTWLWTDILHLHSFLRAHSEDQLWESYCEIVRPSKSSQHSSQNSTWSSSIFSGSANSRSDVTSFDSSDAPSLWKPDTNTSHTNQSESTAYASSTLQSALQGPNSPQAIIPSNTALLAASPLAVSPPAVSPPANQPVWHYCIMCVLRYSSQTSLSKHRREECESKGIWECPCGKQEKRKENMRDHLQDQNSSKCGNPCKSSDNSPCSTHRSRDTCVNATFKEYPLKKVWGCPVCGSCFNTDRDWYQHEKVHYANIITQGRQIFITGWSKNMLVTALLNSNFFRSAAAEYNWRPCRWDIEDVIGDSEFKKLTFTLERHYLAPQIGKDGIYARLSNRKALVAYAYYMGLYGAPFPAVDDPTTSVLDSRSENRQATATATLMRAKETIVDQGNVSNYNPFRGAPGKEACLDSSSPPGHGSEPVASMTSVTNPVHSDLQQQNSKNSLHHTQSSRLKSRGVIGRFANLCEAASNVQRIQEKTLSRLPADISLTIPTHLQTHMTNLPSLSNMSHPLPAGLQPDRVNFYNQLSQALPIHVQGGFGSPLLDHTSQSMLLNVYNDPGPLERQQIPNLGNVDTGAYPPGADHILSELYNNKRDSLRMSWIATSTENQVPPGASTAFVPSNTFLGEPELSAGGIRSSFNSRQFSPDLGQSPFDYQQS